MRCAERSRSVEVFKDRLRLAWSWQGKRFWLYMGWPDTAADPTQSFGTKQPKLKLGPWVLEGSNLTLLLATLTHPWLSTNLKNKNQFLFLILHKVQDFDRFVEYKKRRISIATLAKYTGLQKQVSVFFRNKTSVSVSCTFAENLRDWLSQKL